MSTMRRAVRSTVFYPAPVGKGGIGSARASHEMCNARLPEGCSGRIDQVSMQEPPAMNQGVRFHIASDSRISPPCKPLP